MNSIASPVPPVSNPIHKAGLIGWSIGAWRVLRNAPVRIVLLAWLPILFEGVVQLLPGSGIVLSKLLTPLVSCWVLVMLHALCTQGRFAPSAAVAVCRARWRGLMAVVLLAFMTFAFQMLVAGVMAGPGQATALALGDIGRLSLERAQLAGILAVGIVPAMALMFVMPLLMLDGMGLTRALRDNVRAIALHRGSVSGLTVLLASGVAAAVYWPLVLLPLSPAMLCIGYSAYRATFHGRNTA